MYSHMNNPLAGQTKNVQNYISARCPDGHTEILFTPLAPFETQEALDRICEEYNHVIGNYDVEPLIAATWEIMLYIVPFYFTWTFIEVLSGVLRGVGDAVVPAIICGVGICLLRVLWVLTVCRIYPGLPALCICYPVSWIATDVAFIIRYRSGRWQREKVRI